MKRATKLRSLALQAWIAAVFFVYPIPHTIALRNLLLVGGLLACAWSLRRASAAAVRQASAALRRNLHAGALLAALTLWLVFQSTVLSPYPREALNLFAGDWLVALVVLCIGIAAAATARLDDARGAACLLRALVLALAAHVVLLLAYQGWRWLAEGVFPLGETPFAHRDYHSMLVTTLTALLLADLIARRLKAADGLPLPAGAEIALLALACVATITLATRNAVIVTLALLALAVLALLTLRRRPGGRGPAQAALALLVLACALAWGGLRSDVRWQGFIETAVIALDTEGHQAWQDPRRHPWPQTAAGRPVEESAYLRIAWAKVALEQITRYPLGLGYGHKAFGWAVNRSYGVRTGILSSHSGLLDFTLANGIPGILLWLALSGALCAAGWRAWRRENSAAGLALVFAVASYLVRCLLDGHLADFRLEMYALLVGALVTALPGRSEACA